MCYSKPLPPSPWSCERTNRHTIVSLHRTLKVKHFREKDSIVFTHTAKGKLLFVPCHNSMCRTNVSPSLHIWKGNTPGRAGVIFLLVVCATNPGKSSWLSHHATFPLPTPFFTVKIPRWLAEDCSLSRGGWTWLCGRGKYTRDINPSCMEGGQQEEEEHSVSL